jgi:hypothetical protein
VWRVCEGVDASLPALGHYSFPRTRFLVALCELRRMNRGWADVPQQICRGKVRRQNLYCRALFMVPCYKPYGCTHLCLDGRVRGHRRPQSRDNNFAGVGKLEFFNEWGRGRQSSPLEGGYVDLPHVTLVTCDFAERRQIRLRFESLVSILEM